MSSKNKKPNKDNSFWKTQLGRAIFGYSVEIDCDPRRFFNFEYIQGFLIQESLALKAYSRTFLTIFLMNSITLFYMKGIQFNLTIYGLGFDKIPASAEIICLFLGLGIFGLSIGSLDIICFARMRYVLINKLLGTDLTNMALAHLKNNGLWIDLITPRFNHFASGKVEGFVSLIYILILSIFNLSIFFASSYSLWTIYNFILEGSSVNAYSIVVASSGLIIGSLGVIIFIISQYIPFKFTLPDHQKLDNNQSGALLKDGGVNNS